MVLILLPVRPVLVKVIVFEPELIVLFVNDWILDWLVARSPLI